MIAFPHGLHPSSEENADDDSSAASAKASADAFENAPAGVSSAPLAHASSGALAHASAEASANDPAVDLETLGDQIAILAAHLHAATYQLLVLVAEFDRREGWGGGGFRSCAHWLSWRTGIGLGPAREKVRVARALATLPRISPAMARGELSFSKVRALSRVATTDNEAGLLEVAQHAPASELERLVRAWRRVDRIQEAQEDEARHQRRSLSLYPDEDGSWVLRGRLDPEVGSLLKQALEWAAEALYRREASASSEDGSPEDGSPLVREAVGFGRPADSTPFPQRWADALGLVAERAMAGEAASTASAASADFDEERGRTEDSGTSPSPGRADRFQVILHVSAQTQGSEFGSGQAVLADGGMNVSAETSRRLACDASLVVMTHDGTGQVLDVGRKRRTVPPALRRALEHRDRGCQFPGCSCRYTDAHHLKHWADGGETRLDNLLLLCRHHHRLVHEGGFRLEVASEVETEKGKAAEAAGTAGTEVNAGVGVSSEAAASAAQAVCAETAGRPGAGAGTGEGRGARVRFYDPQGRLIPPVPPAPQLGPDAPADLFRIHRSQGIQPGQWTATPDWHGERMDLGLPIDMLWTPGSGGA